MSALQITGLIMIILVVAGLGVTIASMYKESIQEKRMGKKVSE